jgi:hypothetical protein
MADGWTYPDSLDAMQAAADHHRVLLENDQVRVLESWAGPGETVPVHTHRWPGVLHVVSWGDFVRYDTAGAPILDSRTGPAPAPGSVMWGEPLTPHSLTNVGTTELRIITVEVKS